MERDINLDHPCKQTCSGWKQGRERGIRDAVRWLRDHPDDMSYSDNYAEGIEEDLLEDKGIIE